MWDLVEDLKHEGRTIILTTHYMEEAEQLCDRVAIMDHGRVIALGTPNELIATVGGADIVEFARRKPVRRGAGAEAPCSGKDIDPSQLTAIPAFGRITSNKDLHQLSVSDLHTTVPRIFESLEGQGLHLSEFRTHSASLEDVFVRLTGRNLRDE